MKQLMKIGIVSTLGLALAIPACAQNEKQPKVVTVHQQPILIGSLGTNSTSSSIGAMVVVSAAEAVASTGHTK